MHEVSIADSLIKTVLSSIEEMSFSRVKEVEVEVGELAFVSMEALKYAFEVLSEGTALEGADVTLELAEGEIACTVCDFRGFPERVDAEKWHTAPPILSCPKCKGYVEISKGRDIIVKNMKLEVDD